MPRRMLPVHVLALLCLVVPVDAAEPAPATLELGMPAPDFDLPGVDGHQHRLSDFADAKLLVVVFTCNHCPTAQAYEDRIAALHTDYRDKGVALVAISPNDPLAVRLDELGYTDVGDSFDDMKQRASERGWTFPYLYDGETQTVSRAYGVLATPHVFVFDADRKLRYNGRIDDNDIAPPTSHDARSAIDALLAGRDVPASKTRVFGCSTKWAEKRESAAESLRKWDAEPVTLDAVDAAAIREIAANKTENYRLVNIWSVTCVPCIAEFPELVTINRMYRGRHFEMITVCMDSPDVRDDALGFLTKHHVSCRNVLLDSGDRDELAEALDPKWEGPVPYTLLIAPGGEIVRRWKDEIDSPTVKRGIVERLGRTYASRKK